MAHKITYLEDDNYDLEDDLPAELDLESLTVVRRGPKPESLTVALATDVAAVFNTSDAVNEALRTLIRVMREMKTAA
jgi:RNase adaptor protein for sRNA GlmZ degradation